MSGKQGVDKEVARKLEEFNKTATDVANDIVFNVFPKKILNFQQLIDSTSEPSSPFHPSHATNFTDVTIYPPPAMEEHEQKKRKLNPDANLNGPSSSGPSNDVRHARYPNLVLANKHTINLHDILKKECEELAESCDKVKLWVNLSMPKIEDGDNFGVQIQEEVLTELHRSQESAYNLRDAARQDHINRAKLCSKMIKYPHIEDYALALKEHDQKQIYLARQNLYDLRNVYAILTDILHKNMAKIRSPKGNNATGLY
ncbi:proteasome activator pa28 REG alpha/beta subunit [Sparassis latifolia]|uniref:Proteasome activator pa28, REG alpha/beta subunit n=1 Tax=Sparassis crispa TaxID=139825 RepID=A0A401G5G9_9APHY|nr:proteasome activator pa28, REG alpha/beta subunit [Sparassis crispa]GBE77412.1 proteasome activator pa28, REG alpha/beta subunit [Sparassis crispa]